MYWEHHGFHPFFCIIFFLVIGFVIYNFAIRRRGMWRDHQDQAENLLRKRLANSEISIEEYNQLKEALKK